MPSCKRAPTILLGFLLPWKWGVSSRLLQQSTAVAPTLDEGYLLTAAPPDLERGIAPLGPPAPAQPLFLGHGVAPPGHRWPWMLERPLFANKAIHFIRSFILEKNHINVICVAIDILESHDLQFITEFILERTLINEMYVAVM